MWYQFENAENFSHKNGVFKFIHISVDVASDAFKRD